MDICSANTNHRYGNDIFLKIITIKVNINYYLIDLYIFLGDSNYKYLQLQKEEISHTTKSGACSQKTRIVSHIICIRKVNLYMYMLILLNVESYYIVSFI